ncbi:MAG: hypothetical protein P4L55_05480 [Syntrophobacteraceae bacterium]|nr:hypothetical protein [Syntrophobacteraceae bacterium]
MERLSLRKTYFVFLVAVLLLTLSMVSQASATIVNDLVTFTATDFTSAFGQPVPTSPVQGSFTITFDSTLNYTDATSGIALYNAPSLNIALDSALSFSYNATTDYLVVGGLNVGAAAVELSPGQQNDFYLQILTFTTAPTFNQLGYTVAGGPDSGYFYTPGNGLNGSVTVGPAPIPTPEPCAILLLGSGLVGIVTFRRKFRAQF